MKCKIFLGLFFMLLCRIFVIGDITSNLLHHWKMDTTTNDETGSNNATAVGAVNWVDGVDGDSILFFNNSYATIDDSTLPSGSSIRTISLNVKLKGDDSTENIFSYGSSGNGNSFLIVQTKKGIGVEFGGHFWGSTQIYSGWTSIIVVIPSIVGQVKTQDAQIYINGSKITGSTIQGSSRNLNTILSNTGYFGTDLALGNFLNNAVDDIRVYGRALNSTEIKELYDIYQTTIEKNGEKGWSPILAVESVDAARYLKIIDWTGGEGAKPLIPVGPYLGTGGFGPISQAIDIRGTIGPQGIQGATGLAPSHEWLNTSLRFMDPDGTWGPYVELKGETGEPGPPGVQLQAQGKGLIIGTFPVYESDTTVTICAGYGICYNEYWEMNYDKTVSLAGDLPSGEDFLYIYIDKTSVVADKNNPTFYGSIEEPIYDINYFGWYNVEDRCIGVVWVNDSGIIPKFQNNSQNEYIGYVCIKRVLENGNPGSTYKTLETTAYIPVNAIGVHIYAKGRDADNTSQIIVTPFENITEKLINYSLISYVATAGWLALQRGWSRDLKWYGPDNDDNVFLIEINGFRIER